LGHEGALEDYNKAIQLNPHDSKAFSNRSALYCKSGNYSRAIMDATTAISINPLFAYPIKSKLIEIALLTG
jgi:tetratricopeptide (TPR) repeat protein